MLVAAVARSGFMVDQDQTKEDWLQLTEYPVRFEFHMHGNNILV